tara:strand:- start:936 stop:1247 length:312 start_codon:yes stop_codon:yes gene_type:complete
MAAIQYIGDWTAILAFFITLITLCVLLRKHIAKPISNAIQRQLVEVIQVTVQPHLEFLRSELTFNGGHSLKDNVKDLRDELEVVRSEMKELRDPQRRDRSTDR